MNRILVLGVNGMLGSTVFKYLSQNESLEVFGIARRVVPELDEFNAKIIVRDNFVDPDVLIEILSLFKPTIIINCVGIVKQLESSNNLLQSVPINSLLPHRLSSLCRILNSRLVHFSTDCVFSGLKGNYLEKDIPDPLDLYGRTKLLGEVSGYESVTLRTSIIGHELNSKKSLLNWFLSTHGSVKGYKNAYFSGLTTLEVAKVLEKYVIPNKDLHGLYHLASNRISKYDLLQMISKIYNHKASIIPDEEVSIDRSLNCEKFIFATGYTITSWQDQINEMYKFK